ncbi:MAG: cyclohexanone monooxygenase, partial [Pseudomonadota bacterium]
GLRFRGVFQDLVANETANATAAEFLKAKIRGIVKDPATAEALSDIDHPYGGKRPPIDTHYFETFNRPDVTLVNLRETPIERITPEGVVTSAGLHALDVLVFATGFDAMTGPLLNLGIEAEGRTLNDAWAEGPSTYLGLQIPGFPNLFTITGPGSPSVLTNMPVAIEQHAEWIADCLEALEAKGETRLEAAPEAAAAWGAHVQEAGNATLLPRVPHSWYLGANVPGKPRVFMPYAGGMTRYRAICEAAAAAGYAGFRAGQGEAPPPPDFLPDGHAPLSAAV